MARTKKEKRGQGITVRTPSVRDEFLTLIANGASIKKACETMEIARSSIHKWMREDDEFLAQYEEAVESSRDVIRDEIFRRGVQGVRRVKVVGGKIIYEREYSDRMLTLLAQMRLPEAKNTGEGVTINNNTLNVTQMSEEQFLDALRARGIPLLSIEE